MSIKKEYLKALRDLKNKGFFDQKPQKYSLPTVSYVAEEKIKPLLESVPPLQHFIDNHLKKFTDFWGSEEQHGKRIKELSSDPVRLDRYTSAREEALAAAHRNANEDHQIALMRKNAESFGLSELEIQKKASEIRSMPMSEFEKTARQDREALRSEIIKISSKEKGI